MSYAGQPLKRREDPRLLTGHGSFVDDLQLPDMLYACILRSPYAHARLTSIAVEAARRLPGVVVVLTGADIAGALGDLATRAMEGEWQVELMRGPEQPVLARDKVCYVGQPVAVVAARDRYVARDAVDLIQVDYEPLPPILDPLEAAREDSNPIHAQIGTNIALRIRHDRQGADLDAAFAQADRIIRQRYEVQRLAPVPLEPRGLVAHYQPREDLLGYIINPLLVRGQVHGGIVQGIGQALWEGMVYSPDGQPLTGSLLDYALPVAAELPEMITATIETPSPMNPLGIKGVGELPTVAAPAAVANAVLDALSGFGVRHIDTPLTAEKIWRAMHAAHVD